MAPSLPFRSSPTGLLAALSLCALAACSVAACGPAPRSPETVPSAGPPRPGPTSSSSPTTSPAHTLPAETDIEVTLSPEVSPTSLVRVTIAARSDDSSLVTWQSPVRLDLLGEVEASDDVGPLPITADPTHSGSRFTLSRA